MADPNWQPNATPGPRDRERILLDFAISQSRVIFYIVDLAGERPLKFISSNVEAITGHKVEAFLADPRYGRLYVHTDDRPEYDDAVRVLREAGTTSREYRFKTVSGDWLWFRDELRLHRDPANGLEEIVASMIDVTSEKRAEEERRRAESLNAAIIGSAQHAIVAIDDEGVIVEFNPAAQTMFGIDRSQAIGRTASDLLVPERYRARHEAGVARLREFGQKPGSPKSAMRAEPIEASALKADGSEFPVEITVGRAVLGQRSILVAEITDITDRIAAETERQRLATLLQDAVESLPHGFSITGRDGRLMVANSAMMKRYGLDPATQVGRPIRDIARKMLPLIRSFDGQPITDSAEAATMIAEHTRRMDGGSVEVGLSDGNWRLVTYARPSEGGQVMISTDITRLKEAEAALRQSEQHFRLLVENHPLPVWLVDPESGEVLYESPEAATMFGREWPSLEPHSILEHYADPAQRVENIEELRRKGELKDIEFLAKAGDGTVFPVSGSARLLEFQGREVLIASMIDLTERKQRETEVRHARETLEDAIGSLTEGFALYDTEGRLVTCNEQYRTFNQVCADIIEPGMHWYDLIRTGGERGQYAASAEAVADYLRDHGANGIQLTDQLEYKQTDGRWLAYSTQRTRANGTVATLTDITKRKEFEAELRQSEARLRQVLEASPVPIGLANATDGTIIYESPASQQLFGRDPSGNPSVAVDRFADPEEHRRFLRELRTRGSVDDQQVRLQKFDGSNFPAAISARRFTLQDEDVIVSTVVDLTERLEVEDEFNRRREALHQSEKLTALGGLLAGVAHELNNPLSIVLSQALLLEETTDDTRIADRAVKIGNAADRCSRIIKTFLAIARRQPAEAKAVNLNDVIENTLEVVGYSLRSSDIDISLRLSRSLPAVLADTDQLNQVLTNLVVNAQQALQEIDRPRTLKITTSYRKQRGLVVLKVKDNGPGIPSEHLTRIFEPFFTTKAVGSGTGIGLAFCHQIVAAHGGSLSVEATGTAGTSFVVKLPVTDLTERPGAAAADEPVPARRCTTLIIDDEAEVLEILADILQGDGGQVSTARSGREALERLAQGDDFDVVISDLRMPDLDGPGLYRALATERPELADRVAFITGDTLSPDLQRFLKASNRPWLEKPFTPQAVRELVLRILEGGGGAARDR